MLAAGIASQRQSITRTLIGNPRLPNFDKVNSALDYESERMIQDNIKAFCQGRAVRIIAHRHSAVRDANRIVMLDRGRIVKQGIHAELLLHEAADFARLQRMQQG